MKLIKLIVLLGDILFILWILYNGVDEGFRAILSPQGIIPLSLAFLLLLNSILLWKMD